MTLNQSHLLLCKWDAQHVEIRANQHDSRYKGAVLAGGGHICSGALATSGSVRRYLLPTEVARWFAKAPSTVSRVWRGHQDTEQCTGGAGRGGGQQGNIPTTGPAI